MNKLLDWVKQSRVKLIFAFLLCICMFGNHIFLNFAVDTYATFDDVNGVANLMLYFSARILIGLVYKLWILSGITNETFYYISYMGAMIFSFCAVYLLQSSLQERIRNDFWRICVSFVTVINIYSIEYFMFLEKGMFMMAIFFNVLAFYHMLTYWKTGKKTCLFVTLVSLICAVFTYQGTMGLFVILCLPFVFKYAANLKEYVKNMFTVMLFYGIACATNMFVLLVICNSDKANASGN